MEFKISAKNETDDYNKSYLGSILLTKIKQEILWNLVSEKYGSNSKKYVPMSTEHDKPSDNHISFEVITFIDFSKLFKPSTDLSSTPPPNIG